MIILVPFVAELAVPIFYGTVKASEIDNYSTLSYLQYDKLHIYTQWHDYLHATGNLSKYQSFLSTALIFNLPLNRHFLHWQVQSISHWVENVLVLYHWQVLRVQLPERKKNINFANTYLQCHTKLYTKHIHISLLLLYFFNLPYFIIVKWVPTGNICNKVWIVFCEVWCVSWFFESFAWKWVNYCAAISVVS